MEKRDLKKLIKERLAATGYINRFKCRGCGDRFAFADDLHTHFSAKHFREALKIKRFVNKTTPSEYYLKKVIY